MDATSLKELWDSQMNSSRDSVGNYAKFMPPTVVNGKVYLSTFSTSASATQPAAIVVYGEIAAPDFALSAAPPSQTVPAGNSASFIVYANPVGGYSGTVALTCPGAPSGITCSFTQSSLTLAQGGGEVNTGLTINTSASSSGTYNVTVSGTDGTLTHTATFSVSVTGGGGAATFSLAATALTPATVTAGGTATSTVTLAPAGGFSSAVSLTCAVTPATAVPPTCKFSSGSVAGGSGTSTLTVTTVAAVASLRPNRGRSIFYAMLLPLGGLTILGAGYTSRRRKLLGLLLVSLLMSGLIFLAACGGGSGGGGGGGNGGGTPGTTQGAYTVTVTGTAGTLTQAQSLAVTVQ
jgi:hypothetical protein